MIYNEAAGTNSLVILDDGATSDDVKNRGGELVRLGMSGRYDGISVIVLTQQLTSIAKAFREQIAWIVTFYNTDGIERNFFLKKYLDELSPERRREISKFLKEWHHAHLVILLRKPYDYFLECS